MEIDKVYDGADDVLLPTESLPPSSAASQFLDSFWISKSSPSFQGPFLHIFYSCLCDMSSALMFYVHFVYWFLHNKTLLNLL